MKLNELDFSVLEKIVLGLELTLEYTDLHIDSYMPKELKRIIRKLKRDD